MANLETISIEIGANTSQASQGIQSLVGSLRTLTKGLGAAATAAHSLVRALKQLNHLGLNPTKGMNLNNAVPTNAVQATAAAQNSGTTAVPQTQVPRNAQQQITTNQQIGNSAATAAQKVGTLGTAMGQIGRIAKTMVIRTALRSLMKQFSQAWESAYKFSKAMGGDFAKSVDTVKGSLQGAAISIISALAPAMNVIAPVIQVMANAIKYLADALKNLLEMLGVSSEMFGASIDDINRYGQANKKTTKEILASFDELNVIGKDTNGSGSGSSAPSTSGLFSDKITDELAKIQMAVGAASIAIGCMLAFGGHIPLGVGMIALGAASMVKTVVNDWGKITQDTKNEIATITAAASVALLALGTILAFSGHIGLGVGLIAAGASGLATTIAVKDTLTPDIKEKISTITAVAGAALLGLGVILAFSGQLGMGIGLIVVGAASLATSVAFADSLTPEVKSKLATITAIAGASLIALGAILCFTGAGLPMGIGLILAGSASLAAAVALDWNGLVNKVKSTFESLKEKLTGIWNSIGAAVSGAWEHVKEWAATTWSKFSTSWENIKTRLRNVWIGIQNGVIDAWNMFVKWKNARWADIQVAWSNIKTNLSNAWVNIQNAVINAWNIFVNWKNARWADIQAAWTNIKTYLSDVWSKVQTAVSDAWSRFVDWKNAKWADIQTAWNNIKTNLQSVWVNVHNSVGEAWNRFIDWKNARWSDIQAAWTNIKTGLSGAWNTVQTAVGDAWTKVSEWWTTNVYDKISDAWGSIVGFFNGIVGDNDTGIIGAFQAAMAWVSSLWTGISGKVQEAWGGIKDWFSKNITTPIKNLFKGMINGIIDGLNWIIDKINDFAHLRWDKVEIFGVTVIPALDTQLFKINRITRLAITADADGAYDIPKGQIFIANEAGPELVGQIGNHTTVANQQQIVDGIANGVRDANAEQNSLLREQNMLLRGILSKTGSGFGASSALGRTVRQSMEMYDMMIGGQA